MVGCSAPRTPEEVAKEFIEALMEGKCQKALTLTREMSRAESIVEEFKNQGCVPYILDYKSVYCTTQGETAYCQCYQSEKTATKSVAYDLIKVDGAWWIDNFEELDY